MGKKFANSIYEWLKNIPLPTSISRFGIDAMMDELTFLSVSIFSNPELRMIFIYTLPYLNPCNWWAQGGLNPWPTGYEPVALPG